MTSLRNHRHPWVPLVLVLVLAGTVAGGCNPDRLPPTPDEVTRPLLADDVLDPDHGSLMVDRETRIAINFSEPMDPETFDGHLLVKAPDGTVAEGTFSAEGASILFSPSPALEPATFYNVELRGRIRDANGNTIELNGQPVLDDTTLIYEGWFFTNGPYAEGGNPRSFVLDLRGRIWEVTNLEEETGTITDGLGSAPKGLVRSDNWLVAINGGESKAVLYDLATGGLVASLDVARDPVAVDASGGMAYVVSAAGKAITQIDVANATVVKEIGLPFFPGMIGIAPDGSKLYTLDQVSGDLNTIDPSSGDVVATLPHTITIPVTGRLLVNRDNGNVYVADTRGDVLKVVSPDGTQIIQTLEAGLVGDDEVWRPVKMAFSSGGLWVVPQNSPMLYQMDPTAGTLRQSYSFESPVKGVEVLEGGNPAVVLVGSEMQVMDTSTGTILRTIALVDSNPDAVTTVR